jgi:hypothetical protein
MQIHQDWRGKIHDALRASRTKLAGDYIQRSLDYFNLLLPKLVVGREVVMQRRDVSQVSKGEWSEASIGKFLQHLVKANVVEVRNAGSRGLGITLKHDLTESPWKSRRSDTGRVIHVVGAEAIKEPETPMTAAPPPVRDVPSDDDYCTNLDLDLTLSALDAVSLSLLKVDLNFAKEFSGEPAAKLYKAQKAITIAVRQLGQIRSAIGAGDDSDLEEIVASAP